MYKFFEEKLLKREVAKIYEEHVEVLIGLRVLRVRVSGFVSSRFKPFFYFLVRSVMYANW